MSKSFHFYLVSNSTGPSNVVDPEYIPQLGLTEEEFTETFKDLITRHEVTLKPQSFGMKKEINEKTQVPDIVTGFKVDPNLIPAARAATVIESWTLKDAQEQPIPITVAGFQSIPSLLIGEHIDAKVIEYLYPDVSRNPDFFGLFKARQKPSGDTPKES